MLNLLQILFLIFGWIYNIRGLLITALVIDSILMVVTFAFFIKLKAFFIYTNHSISFSNY